MTPKISGPKLSILIAHYNHNEFLPALLDNISEQNFKNDIEVVIIDDCSDVSPEPIVRRDSYDDLNIVFKCNEERLYTKDTRLKAVEVATSDLVTFADADDHFLEATRLNRLVNAMIHYDVDILHFCTLEKMHNTNRRPVATGWNEPFGKFLNGSEIFRLYVENSCRAHTVWGKIFKKSLWIKCMDFAKCSKVRRYQEDLFLISLLFSHAQSYMGSPAIGYVQNVDATRGNIAVTRAPGNMATCYHMLNELPEYFIANGIDMDIVEKFKSIVLSLMISNYTMLFDSIAQRNNSHRNDYDAMIHEILETMSEHTDTETLQKILLMCLFTEFKYIARPKTLGGGK
ncbi:MAG: glycosyltransferase family 2 protein [Desulfovibrio sp.]|jgi:glycosyltransferase involved in cell wall biosynthesis|nr:glycosyltransferase family 2 protein [Desulfovibrio sp.]